LPTIHVRDLELYYRVHGDPDGEPLILLHSFLSTGRFFEPFLEGLGRTYRVFVPDWRGHGRTVDPRGEIVHTELARDTVAFSKALGLDKAHFCGHSSGGMHLLSLAIDHPQLIQTLTLVSATYTFDDYLKSQVREAREEDGPGWVDALNILHGDRHGPGYGETILDLWVDSIHRPGELDFTTEDLGKISCPTLIMHGDRDRYFPVHVPETMYQSIPRAELSIFPNCGHLLPKEYPQIFENLLLDFLTRNPF
jgi:pimeloyl-ACP methyl ester carboxylesterase